MSVLKITSYQYPYKYSVQQPYHFPSARFHSPNMVDPRPRLHPVGVVGSLGLECLHRPKTFIWPAQQMLLGNRHHEYYDAMSLTLYSSTSPGPIVEHSQSWLV